MKIELIDIVPVGNILGECVLWNGEKIWWTDIESSLLFTYEPIKKELKKYNAPKRIGSFCFTEDDDWLIAAFEDGLAFYNPNENLVDWIEKPPIDKQHIRFNDGRVDRQGRFWVGTMVENGGRNPREKARLYRLEKNGTLTAMLDDIFISNSLCWSPDGTKIYFADSPLCRIDLFDFDPVSGALANRRSFAQTKSKVHPDGSTIDEEGFLWNAQWGGSSVVRYTAEGTIDYVLELPISQPTCVTFGGADLSWLIVSSAQAGLSRDTLANEKHAGDLFIYKTSCRGLAENRVQFPYNNRNKK